MSEVQDVNSVAGFLLSCLDRGGGAWEVRGDSMIDALLPDEVADSLGGDPLRTLALSPESLGNEPEAELATPGSPAMDAFIKFAATVGRTSVGVVLPSHVRGKGLREEVSRQVTYRNCRLRYSDDPPKVRDSYYAVYSFRVEYISDERREQIILSAIDLTSLRPNRPFIERLPHLVIENDSVPSSEWFADNRLERGFEVARVDLMMQIQSHAEALLVTARKRFEVESLRLADYYGQVAAELRRRLQKETDESKQAGIVDKIAIAKAEGERKTLELSEKYRIRPRATLTSILLIRQPKTFFDLFVDRGLMTRRVTFVFDSLLDRLELPYCDQCGDDMTTVVVSAKGMHLCPKCGGS